MAVPCPMRLCSSSMNRMTSGPRARLVDQRANALFVLPAIRRAGEQRRRGRRRAAGTAQRRAARRPSRGAPRVLRRSPSCRRRPGRRAPGCSCRGAGGCRSTRAISSSRQRTGSSRPARASAVRSRAKRASAPSDGRRIVVQHELTAPDVGRYQSSIACPKTNASTAAGARKTPNGTCGSSRRLSIAAAARSSAIGYTTNRNVTAPTAAPRKHQERALRAEGCADHGHERHVAKSHRFLLERDFTEPSDDRDRTRTSARADQRVPRSGEGRDSPQRPRR